MSQGDSSFIGSDSDSSDHEDQAEKSLPDFPYSSISNKRSEIDPNSFLSSNRTQQIEMQPEPDGLNEHLSQGSFVSEKRRQSEAGNFPPRISNRDTLSVVSGTISENKDSFLTNNFRKTTGLKVIKVIDEREEEDGESTEPDSDRSASKFREQFAVPLGMANISSEAITAEKIKKLDKLNWYIKRRSGNVIVWQKAWNNMVLEHRKLGQELWRKLEKMLKETIENMKKNKEKLKKYKGNEENKLTESIMKKEIIPEIEEVIEDLEKGLVWAKGKYERFIWRFRVDEKVEKTVKEFQEKCEGFLKKNENIEGGLYTAEMAMIFQVQSQVNIEEEFGEIMTKILEGVKEIEEKGYRRFSEVMIQRKISREELQIECEENIEEFTKTRYSVFEGELVEDLGSIKFKISKYVEENSLLLYQCQGFFYYKEKKLKENAVRIGLTADGWLIVFEVDAEKRKVEILKQWSWSSAKIEEHKENKDMVVIEKFGIEFNDILDKKGFLNRFEKFKI